MRLFSSLGLVVAPPACEPGPDTTVIFGPRLDRLASGQPPLLTARSPDATGLASSLSGCLWFTGQRCRLWHRRRFGRFFTGLAWASCPTRYAFSFCPAFRRLSLRGCPVFQGPPDRAPVLVRSSNRVPSGNCDPPGLETLPGCLTRLEAVSHRLSTAQFLDRVY